MKVKEILDKMDDFSDEGRERYLMPLLSDLTAVSQHQIIVFQDNWDGTKSFEEFKKAQNKEIRDCVEMELSDFGVEARKVVGLQPLTEDTEF